MGTPRPLMEDLRNAYWVLNKALMDIKAAPEKAVEIAEGALYEGAVLADYEQPVFKDPYS